MLIDLPIRYHFRKAALAWLVAEDIPHIVLFQQVKVREASDARRFQVWLESQV